MRIRSGERTLAADLYPAPRPDARAGLLFVHGYASDRRGYVTRATAVRERLGITCLAFDLGGHGESPGELRELTREDHAADVVAAYDALAATEGVERIGVCGASYGAYLACVLLGERPVRRLMLRAPALYVDGERHLRELIDVDRALANLRDFDGPTLVLESERDEVIARASVEAYLAAARHGTHHVIPGATHALTEPSWNAAFIDEIVAWFDDI